MTQYKLPPLPQNRDKRLFEIGDSVRAHQTFGLGCPPGSTLVEKGTCGSVSGKPLFIKRSILGETIRTVPVQWENGVTGEVIDSLLELKIQ